MPGSLFNITVIAEWICLFMAVLMLSGIRTRWRLFILFLLITIATETLGWYLRIVVDSPERRLPFNILLLIRILFFGWFFSLSEPLKRWKRKILLALSFFTLFAIVNFTLIQGALNYNYYTEVAGDIILIISCYCFFYTLLTEDNPRKLFRYPYFWLSVGLLLSSLGSVVLYIFMEQIIAYHKQTGINIGGAVNNVLSLVLYGSLITAFICQRRLKLSLE